MLAPVILIQKPDMVMNCFDGNSVAGLNLDNNFWSEKYEENICDKKMDIRPKGVVCDRGPDRFHSVPFIPSTLYTFMPYYQ